MDNEALNSITNQIENLTVTKNETTVKTPLDIWTEICDIPVNIDMKITIQWKYFAPGSSIYAIWNWFEDEYHISIDQIVWHALNIMYGD